MTGDVHRAGETVDIEAEVVVSNAGPRATVGAVPGASISRRATSSGWTASSSPTANIVFNIASRDVR